MKGTCRHGEFELEKGCPECIQERRHEACDKKVVEIAEGFRTLFDGVPLVKVQYLSLSTGEISPREYTCYSEDRLSVGDIVTVPVRDTTAKAKVSAIDVSESEIASFKDKVKTIPAGSVMGLAEAAKEAGAEVTVAQATFTLDSDVIKDRISGGFEGIEDEAIDTKVNLCDTCTLRNDYPICYPSDIIFGDGRGNDNIIQCSKHSEGPAKPCSIPLNEEVRQDVEEELIASSDVIQIDPERQQDYIALKKEVEKAIPYAESRVITTMEHAKLASNDLTMIAKLSKAIEDRRVEYVKPLNDYVAEFNLAFRKLSEPLKEAKRVTDQKILAYQRQVADERRKAEQAQAVAVAEAQRKAQEIKETTGEIIEVEPEKIDLPPEPTTRVRTDFGISSQVDNWKYRIIDEKLIPAEYWMLNEVKLGKVVRAGIRDIKGIEIYNEPILRTR